MSILQGYIRGSKQSLRMIIIAMSLVFSAVHAGQPTDEYQQRVLLQIQKIQLTEDQTASFRLNFQAFYKARNGATRRISRSGGDLKVRINRELRKTADKAVKKMSTVLTAEQLQHYSELVKIANNQYLAKSGLLD
jgi:biopolymer transport protein ExbB/TolQ